MKSAHPRVLGLLSLVVFLSVLSAHATNSNSANYYGPGLGSDGLANTVVGGPSGNIVSYRFRAGHSGSLQQIHVYLIQSHAGYSSGTGGQIRVTVNADDGTPAHNPSSTVLATYLLSNPLGATPSIYFPIFVFPVPPTLVAGQLYHIVFTNVDASSATNYLSVDALYYANPTTPAQPTISDVDAGELLGGPSGTWTQRSGYTPILELDYGDGYSEYIGYMEVWVGVPEPISGANAVRETFTVSSEEKTVASASIRVTRTNGTDPLIVRLENGDGTLIEQGEIPAASIPTSYAWATCTFSSAHNLLVGQTYFLEFDSASTSTYQAFPIRKGSAYGFQNTTYFPDGYAQFNPGGSWVGWTQWGVANRTDGDLQFYFTLTNPSAAPTISNVSAGSLSANGATVTWATDQASSSQVEYGTTTAYSNTTPVDTNSVTAHSEPLTGLLASTLYHYRVHSTNSAGNEAISGDLTLTTLSSGPTVSTASLPGGTQYRAYGATLAATGGTLPYQWSVMSGTLPAGLTLASSTGLISGTPTGSGTSTFAVGVTDANAISASKALSITVSAAAPPTITTTALPGGTQNAAYSAALSATGGTSPYQWTIASGNLPAGLALTSSSGAISGTPTGPGTSNFTVQVTDTNSLTATKALSLTISGSGGGGAIGMVQENAVQGSSVNSVSAAFPTANTAGNLIIAFVRMSTTSQSVTFSDSEGNTYVQAVSQLQYSDYSQVRLFYARNIRGGTNTVKATFSSANGHAWLAIYEYRGLSATSPLDRIAHGQGTSSTPNAGLTSATTSPNELVFAGFGFPSSYTGSQTAGSGFTLNEQDRGTSPAANESKSVSTTGSYAATFRLGYTANWSAVVATFK